MYENNCQTPFMNKPTTDSDYNPKISEYSVKKDNTLAKSQQYNNYSVNRKEFQIPEEYTNAYKLEESDKLYTHLNEMLQQSKSKSKNESSQACVKDDYTTNNNSSTINKQDYKTKIYNQIDFIANKINNNKTSNQLKVSKNEVFQLSDDSYSNTNAVKGFLTNQKLKGINNLSKQYFPNKNSRYGSNTKNKLKPIIYKNRNLGYYEESTERSLNNNLFSRYMEGMAMTPPNAIMSYKPKKKYELNPGDLGYYHHHQIYYLSGNKARNKSRKLKPIVPIGAKGFAYQEISKNIPDINEGLNMRNINKYELYKFIKNNKVKFN